MNDAPTKPDLRRTLTCAVLATITTTAMFSLVANIMPPLFSGIELLASSGSTQKLHAAEMTQSVCVKGPDVADDPESARPATI
jgi:hypothetical protein